MENSLKNIEFQIVKINEILSEKNVNSRKTDVSKINKIWFVIVFENLLVQMRDNANELICFCSSNKYFKINFLQN